MYRPAADQNVRPRDEPMTVKLHIDTAWERIQQLAERSRRETASIAVPFLGAGASDRLPLRRGDLLVTRFDDAAIRGGLVDPREVVKYLRRGVEVHAVTNLHAKVFAFGDCAIVGSTNVSAQSEAHLVEAVCESDVSKFVSACTRFVRSLRGDEVGLEYARRKVPLFKPPKFAARGRRSRTNRAPLQSALSVVMLQPCDYDTRDTEVQKSGKAVAERQIKDRKRFAVEDFRWSGAVPPSLRPGSRVLMCLAEGKNRVSVDAPARILAVRKYRRRSGTRRALIFVETRKWARQRSLSDLIRRVPRAAVLRRIRSCRQIRDWNLAFQLSRVWTAKDGDAA